MIKKQLKSHGARLVQTAALFMAAMNLLTTIGSTEGAALRRLPAEQAGWVPTNSIALLVFIGSLAVLATLSPMVLWKWRIVNGVLEQVDVDAAPKVTPSPTPRSSPPPPGDRLYPFYFRRLQTRIFLPHSVQKRRAALGRCRTTVRAAAAGGC